MLPYITLIVSSLDLKCSRTYYRLKPRCLRFKATGSLWGLKILPQPFSIRRGKLYNIPSFMKGSKENTWKYLSVEAGLMCKHPGLYFSTDDFFAQVHRPTIVSLGLRKTLPRAEKTKLALDSKLYLPLFPSSFSLSWSQGLKKEMDIIWAVFCKNLPGIWIH